MGILKVGIIVNINSRKKRRENQGIRKRPEDEKNSLGSKLKVLGEGLVR